jgi:ABC-type uncharacterized transport system fused permease/ATPase subunit
MVELFGLVRLIVNMFAAKLLLQHKAFYKLMHVHRGIDVPDQRLTQDLEKLCLELANTFPEMVKPVADILWFRYVCQLLSASISINRILVASAQSLSMIGVRKTALLYLYALGGLGFLRLVAPDFEGLVQTKASLEGAFRYVWESVWGICLGMSGVCLGYGRGAAR